MLPTVIILQKLFNNRIIWKCNHKLTLDLYNLIVNEIYKDLFCRVLCKIYGITITKNDLYHT